MAKAKVILFKESGKYYTEEEWEIPGSAILGREAIGPHDMKYSKDFRRIGSGAVLVETQEPWGFPCLLVKYSVVDNDK
jgi:hypothetical protein